MENAAFLISNNIFTFSQNTS